MCGLTSVQTQIKERRCLMVTSYLPPHQIAKWLACVHASSSHFSTNQSIIHILLSNYCLRHSCISCTECLLLCMQPKPPAHALTGLSSHIYWPCQQTLTLQLPFGLWMAALAGCQALGCWWLTQCSTVLLPSLPGHCVQWSLS